MQIPSCGNCTRRQEVCEYVRVTSYPESLPPQEAFATDSSSWTVRPGELCGLLRKCNGTVVGIQPSAAPVGDIFVPLLKAVLDHAWFTPTESNLWAAVLTAKAESNPYLQHCIFSLVSIQARSPDQAGSAVAYEHHLRASELFRNVTPVVTESNWAAVLAFQVFVLIFELTAQTYCHEAEFSIANTIKTFRWNSAIGKEARPYFQRSEMWQHVQRRTAGTKVGIDQGLKLSLRALESTIVALNTHPERLTDDGRKYAKSCQQAFRGLHSWILNCKGYPRRWDQYYHWPLVLSPVFIQALSDNDDIALLLVLYWTTVLCRSPKPAVSKWAHRTASTALSRLKVKPTLQALLVWPRCMLGTATPAQDHMWSIIATQLLQQTV